MTDNEIIKAFECCSNDDDGSGCGNCPLSDKYPYCDDALDKQIIDIINRKSAEIDRLIATEEKAHQHCRDVCEPKYKTKIAWLEKENDRLSQSVLYHDGHIADAIKEFADRFKSVAGIYQKDTYVIGVDEFDSLVKEMVGDDNE